MASCDGSGKAARGGQERSAGRLTKLTQSRGFPAIAPSKRRVRPRFATGTRQRRNGGEPESDRRTPDARPGRRSDATVPIHTATASDSPAPPARHQRIMFAAAARLPRDRARTDRQGATRGARANESRCGRTAYRRAAGAGGARSIATCPPRARRVRHCRFRAGQAERCAAVQGSIGRGRARSARRRTKARDRAQRGSVPSHRMEQADSNIASAMKLCWKLLETGVAFAHPSRRGSAGREGIA